MSEHLTREDLVVAATKAALGAQPDITASMHEYALIVDAALPVIAKAITDRIRTLHVPAGDKNPWCDHDGYSWPCPTVRLCDEIDSWAGVQR